jgi:hypothetical protein
MVYPMIKDHFHLISLVPARGVGVVAEENG